MSASLSHLRRPPDGDAFAASIDAYRRDVVLLCYRFLGSIAEAEEAAQETALRAWRARDRFRGESSIRTWLHRIAARVCLDLLRSRRGRGRVLPAAVAPASTDPAAPPRARRVDVPWLEPIPDDLVAGAALEAASDVDPAARYDRRESVSLAFIAALQSLPARQRAVLLLRDVLGWHAAEAASTLEMSIPAVNSALHRARTAMRTTHHRTGLAAVPDRPPSDAVARRLLDAYIRAWSTDDVGGLLATMREDVRLAMPPSPTWFDGRTAVAETLRAWIFGTLRPPSGYRLVPTRANGQPAALFGPAAEPDRIDGVHVLEVDGEGRLAQATIFLDRSIAERFRPGTAITAGARPRRRPSAAAGDR
jgi:RNA polymerase sigma-70 factor (ECF subfamily)